MSNKRDKGTDETPDDANQGDVINTPGGQVPVNPDQDPGDGGYPGQGTPGVGGNPTNEEMRARAERSNDRTIDEG